MSRRTNQLFSLSLLDLLTSALGAIIFLFIITPKGGESAAKVQQAAVYFDTTQMKIHGILPDSLLAKASGDSLLVILVDHKKLPNPADMLKGKYVYDEPRPKPQPVSKEKKVNKPPTKTPAKTPPRKKEPKPTPPKKPVPEPKPVPKKPEKPAPPVYRGDAPSVPANVSFEIKWASREENVDLYVCKGNSCVYGGNKKDNKVGHWDSGKSRNKLFGNDLRTSLEAVRQFDGIIPGEYKIYADFKESKKNSKKVYVKGLVYTKNAQNQERGENFAKQLILGKGRTLIATVILKKDGTYIMK